jgi:phosphoribosylcarboxyaminoimidazole (NCAIR) mutase
MALVGVVIGSKTDTELIQPALDMLKQLGKCCSNFGIIQ